ncbi:MULTISPECIES: hypothetical protein [Salinivibrio]|uniref:hypothetical protein n=1 Tax=Salinivibrio TaxID=51366 RepID=UPI0009858195|nr:MULTISPECIES: hypothetical protein [Salinivibrio]OOF08106.1 hypothetical protein BZG83_16380 [Salinivibrio sp. PR919]OOF13538.1 hypothetical protein BZG84_15575 [Salinivibrio sp. PR932]OOF32200.1 hypothetical protein BZJ20_03435 [Salinivibrio proteolyticus]
MQYLEVNVKTAIIVHGYDENHKEITETVKEEQYVTKLVAIERLQSVSEQYLLVTGSHGRMMYWEYDESIDSIRQKLEKVGVRVA